LNRDFLSDKQLDIITQVAAALPVEKRSGYLARVAAHLQIRLGRYSDDDVANAAHMALNSLTQTSAA
jgi:predicted glycosyltransferase